MKVIKRDCTLVDFQKEKISNAILKAMKNGSGIVKPKIAEDIANEIYEECKDKDEISISDIEGMVFNKLISKKQRLTAKAYEGYRKIREFQRENTNTTDEQISEILTVDKETWNNELKGIKEWYSKFDHMPQELLDSLAKLEEGLK